MDDDYNDDDDNNNNIVQRSNRVSEMSLCTCARSALRGIPDLSHARRTHFQQLL